MQRIKIQFVTHKEQRDSIRKISLVDAIQRKGRRIPLESRGIQTVGAKCKVFSVQLMVHIIVARF